MKGLFRKLLKYTGYGVFFTAALLFFFYMTLPLDTVQDYLVRKASDEYNADLDITELSTWSLTGFEAAGVTITPRPTAEDLEKMRLGREARQAWLAKQEDEKSKAEDEAKDAKADAASKGKGKGKGKDDPAKAEDAETAKAPKGAKRKKVVKVKKAEKPPPIPRGPQPLHIETLRAKVSPWDLVGGKIDGHLEAALLNGELTAEVKQSPKEVEVEAEWSNLDLAQLDVLEKFLPLPLVGALGGDVDLVVPVDDKNKLLLANAEGTIGLRIQNAAIGPGQIESKKLGAFPYFDVPKTRIQDLGGQLVFASKKATFENFEFTGKDLEGEITGYIKLTNKLERWAPRAHLRFKFSDTFMEAHKAVKTAMTSIPYLKRGQRDGYTGFAVTGTMKKMRWQPRKDSPHKRAKRGAKKKTSAKAKTKRGKLDRTSKSKARSKTRDRKSLRDLQRGKSGDKDDTGSARGTRPRPNLGKVDRPTSLPPIAGRGTTGSSTDDEGDEAEEDTEEDTEDEADTEDDEEPDDKDEPDDKEESDDKDDSTVKEDSTEKEGADKEDTEDTE